MENLFSQPLNSKYKWFSTFIFFAAEKGYITSQPPPGTGRDHECVVCMSKPTLGPVRKWGNEKNYS